jgi:hypothetical protein
MHLLSVNKLRRLPLSFATSDAILPEFELDDSAALHRKAAFSMPLVLSLKLSYHLSRAA